jgi:hypothetical protein
MRTDTHAAALRAAAKVAFSIAFVSGCASAPTETSDDQVTGDTAAQPGSSESDLSADKKKPSEKACEALVDAAFPTPGRYPGKKQAVSSQVQACCDEILVNTHGVTAHRWDCCANLPPGTTNAPISCTPWGPPVPPAMKPRRSWLEVA